MLGGPGFVPVLGSAGYLIGAFQVGGAHNFVHLVTGLIALLAAALGAGASRLFFRVFAGLYGLLALAGIYYGDRPLFGVVAHNWADVWLHLAIAALALCAALGRLAVSVRVRLYNPNAGSWSAKRRPALRAMVLRRAAAIAQWAGLPQASATVFIV